MLEFFGSIFTVIFYFLAFIFLWGVISALLLWWKVRKTIRAARKQQEHFFRQQGKASTNQQEKADTPRTTATDFEQPLYDDANAEYIDYEEVK